MSAATAAVRTAPVAGGRFRPELGLLFACTAGPLDRARALHIGPLFDQPLDWEFLLDFAGRHGLAPLFFWNAQNFVQQIPANALAELSSRYRVNASKNLVFWQMLGEVQELLQREGIASIALKGPLLAAEIYGDVGLREFSDLDLLIRSNDVLRARDILLAAGFDLATEIPPGHERAYLKSGNELAFHRHSHRNVLELQWNVLPSIYAVNLNVENFFQRATLARTGGRHCRTLCAEDLLLVLSVHGAKHAWARLGWICDIAWLLQSRGLDWSAIQEETQRLGVGRILFVSLSLAQEFFHISLPRHLHSEIADDPMVQRLTRTITSAILQQRVIRTNSLEYFLLMGRLRERWRDRLRFGARLAFTPSTGEWSAVSLPAGLSFAYVPVRPCRIVAKLYTGWLHSFADEGNRGEEM